MTFKTTCVDVLRLKLTLLDWFTGFGNTLNPIRLSSVSLMSMVGVLAGCSYIAVMSLSERFVSDPYFKDLEFSFWILSLVLFGVIEFKHLANFRRLLSGNEPKFGKGGEKRSE